MYENKMKPKCTHRPTLVLTLQATAHYHLQRDALDIEVHSEESTSSDQEAFHHQVHVRILRDGQPCFEKDWSISVPRTLN